MQFLAWAGWAWAGWIYLMGGGTDDWDMNEAVLFGILHLDF